MQGINIFDLFSMRFIDSLNIPCHYKAHYNRESYSSDSL
nr:MAG TPA_asm: hypothetical protein [Caudoviricetes sp.]